MDALRGSLVALTLSAFLVQNAAAHHGKDFLIVESYEVPHPGDVYFVSSAAIFHDGSSTTVEVEPSLLIGVVPRVAFELHSHVSREPHETLTYEATAPSIHIQLTPPHSRFPLHFGLSAEYEFAARASAQDRIEARLVVESSFGRSRVAANLVGEHERAGDSALGYAVGYRYEFSERAAFGVEAQGPFTNSNAHEVLAAVYGEPSERITLKVGVGTELGHGGTAFVTRGGVVLRF